MTEQGATLLLFVAALSGAGIALMYLPRGRKIAETHEALTGKRPPLIMDFTTNHTDPKTFVVEVGETVSISDESGDVKFTIARLSDRAVRVHLDTEDAD